MTLGLGWVQYIVPFFSRGNSIHTKKRNELKKGKKRMEKKKGFFAPSYIH